MKLFPPQKVRSSLKFPNKELETQIWELLPKVDQTQQLKNYLIWEIKVSAIKDMTGEDYGKVLINGWTICILPILFNS